MKNYRGESASSTISCHRIRNSKKMQKHIEKLFYANLVMSTWIYGLTRVYRVAYEMYKLDIW